MEIAPSPEREEFSFWISGTGYPDYEENRRIDKAPRKRSALVQYLKADFGGRNHFNEDTWRDTCRTRFFHCLFALCDLSKDGIWPIVPWNKALHVWSENGLVQRSWCYAAPLVRTMPDAVLQKIARSVAWWLEATSKSVEGHEEILLDLCQRILNLPFESGSVFAMTRDNEPIQRPFTEAINHPVGLVVEALLNLWFRRKPNDEDRLPAEIEPLFTRICETQPEQGMSHLMLNLIWAVLPLPRESARGFFEEKEATP